MHGFAPLGFFTFLPIGLIVIALGIAVLLPMSLLLIKKKGKHHKGTGGKTLNDLAEQYQLHDNLFTE